MDDVVARVLTLLTTDSKLSDDIAKLLLKERRRELRAAGAAAKRKLLDDAAVDVRQRNDLRHRLTALETDLASVSTAAGWLGSRGSMRRVTSVSDDSSSNKS